MSSFEVEVQLARKVWKKLRDGPVPIVAREDFSKIPEQVNALNRRLANNAYFPDIGHGFLGLQKGSGVTRFLPILSKEDMAVYYQMCALIGNATLVRRPNIFGGWHSVPSSQKVREISVNRRLEEQASAAQQNYYADSFSDYLWLKEFRSFTELISRLTSVSQFGNYVIQTDVANFYDTIEVPRLTSRLRRDAPNLEGIVSTLEAFLGYWNRRTGGYRASTKGIPQEIISDASRILSHYYLQEFDGKFDAYCQGEELQYVRWEDDILVFGPSVRKLEEAVHRASRLLLPDGLNLNAPKTRVFSRTDFARYRGIDILAAIDSSNPIIFRRRLRSGLEWSKTNPFRLDTVFRATIGFIYNMKSRAKTFEKNFVFETI